MQHGGYHVNMSIKKKRILWIAALIIIAAVVIVLCVGLLTGGKPNEFDGTLVEANGIFQCLL